MQQLKVTFSKSLMTGACSQNKAWFKKQWFLRYGPPTQLLVTEFFCCRKTGVSKLVGEFRALLPHLSYAQKIFENCHNAILNYVKVKTYTHVQRKQIVKK